MSTLTHVEGIRELLAVALPEIQGIYDEWSGDGDDPEFGAGGICDLVCEAMQNHLSNEFCTAQAGQDGDDHAYLYVGLEGCCYEVDLPHHLYERGGGYSWRKVPGVIFTLENFTITPLRVDPAHYDAIFEPDM